mmetsp:Transcript_9825/g.16526  ORF Transcript_9825/g.16526 Transcript_9825/m.16526 type:complete len:205 (+) Transcript_9825:170-784(+)
MAAPKSSKMMRYINYRMRATLSDSRSIVGKFMAFDKHMNLILGDSEEFRVIRSKDGDREEKRTLGLVLVRGENVISLSVEGPPPKNESRNKTIHVPGPGIGKAAGRGIAAISAPAGLGGRGQGVNMPPPQFMQPQFGGPGGAPPPFGMPPGFPGAPPGFQGPPGFGGPPPGMFAGGPPPGFQGGPPPGFNPNGPPPGFNPNQPQ